MMMSTFDFDKSKVYVEKHGDTLHIKPLPGRWRRSFADYHMLF